VHGGKRRPGEEAHHLSAEKTDKQLKRAYPNGAGEFRRAMTRLTVNGMEPEMKTSQDFEGTIDGTRSSRHCGHCRWLAWLCSGWNGLLNTAIDCRGALTIVSQIEAQWIRMLSCLEEPLKQENPRSW
jgi:hypothetical protein